MISLSAACCRVGYTRVILFILFCCARSSTGFVVVAPHRSCKIFDTSDRSQWSMSNSKTNNQGKAHQDTTTTTSTSKSTTTGRSYPDTNTRALIVEQHRDGPRRNILATIGITMFSMLSVNANTLAATASATAMPSSTTTIAAETTTSTPTPSQQAITATATVPMRTFVDPAGLFVLNIPQRFFALRRSAKGDLPDAQTGSGRRGSTIFSAGDMAKAEVVSVEYFPVKVLLQDFGIDAGTGRLQTISDIGDPSAVANLIALRRDKDRLGSMATKIVPNTVTVSADGRELAFQLKTSVPVQKPELLLEQYGVTELLRVTAAKASLITDSQSIPKLSGDKNRKDGKSNSSNNGVDDDVVMMMVVFASALETDWNGPDGVALQETVQSFRALRTES